jgi:signal transduction histidine kinase
VVKDIVQQHKGTISLQSQLGVGTHVFLHLSLRKPS